MVATRPMAKQTKATGAETPVGDTVTTIKCFERIKKKINQLGSLLDLSQHEVIERYERYMDEELLRELAKRQSELRQGRVG